MFKQIIVVRTDLNMSTGKTAAQVAHASVFSYIRANKILRTIWLASGSKKVVLRVNSEQELRDLETKANELNLPCALITDEGLTEVEPNSCTCFGIGPASDSDIDKVTGLLELLR